MICYHTLDEHRDPRTTEDMLGKLPHIHEVDRRQTTWTGSNYYQLYAALTKIVKPKRMLEVGVRLGFSAIAMLAGHPIEDITGIDNERMIKDSQRLAKENILFTGFNRKLDMYVGQSNYVLLRNEFKPFDLIHIDGEHTKLTAMLDIWSAWRFLRYGGTMVVDDAQQPEVREAIEVIRKRLPELKDDNYITKPGWWVAERAG